MVALVVYEHLCFIFQPAKRGRMDDAVTVALVIGARVAFFLGIKPAPAVGRMAGEGRQLAYVIIELYHKDNSNNRSGG